MTVGTTDAVLQIAGQLEDDAVARSVIVGPRRRPPAIHVRADDDGLRRRPLLDRDHVVRGEAVRDGDVGHVDLVAQSTEVPAGIVDCRHLGLGARVPDADVHGQLPHVRQRMGSVEGDHGGRGRGGGGRVEVVAVSMVVVVEVVEVDVVEVDRAGTSEVVAETAGPRTVEPGIEAGAVVVEVPSAQPVTVPARMASSDDRQQPRKGRDGLRSAAERHGHQAGVPAGRLEGRALGTHGHDGRERLWFGLEDRAAPVLVEADHVEQPADRDAGSDDGQQAVVAQLAGRGEDRRQPPAIDIRSSR